MKKTEIIKLLKFINSYYQGKFDYPKEDKADTKMINATWYMFLEDYDYNEVTASMKKLVINKPKWPPTPGELIQEINNNRNRDNPNKISGAEAWQKITRAIRVHSWFYNPKKVKESLPEAVKKAGELISFSVIANSKEGDTYLMNRFIKIFEDMKQQVDEKEMLPPGVRNDFEKIKKSEVQQLVESKKGEDK
jgi:hypothetical protein